MIVQRAGGASVAASMMLPGVSKSGSPDLEMDDVAAGAETRHALGEAEFCGLTHDGETSESESFLIVPS